MLKKVRTRMSESESNEDKTPVILRPITGQETREELEKLADEIIAFLNKSILPKGEPS
jgi:hypothetical protein